MESDPGSGSRWRDAFAFFDRDSCSWRTCQASLLEDSGESCTTWPRQGTWDLGYVYELPTSALLTGEIDSSSSRLLPTPDANVFNEGQTVDAYFTRKAREIAKGYNGNGGGTTLAMMVRLLHEGVSPDEWKDRLLPTPQAHDTGRSPEAHLEMKRKMPGGPRSEPTSLAVVAKLLPTPTGDDANNVTRESGEYQSLAREAHKLLPTPLEGDATGGRTSKGKDRPGEAGLAVTVKLLPTPVVTDSFGSRRSTARTEEWESNPGTTLTDALWEMQGRETDTRGKLLPTPTVQDSANTAGPSQLERNSEPLNVVAAKAARSSGESTVPQSSDGSGSSDEPLPGQLTIGDA